MVMYAISADVGQYSNSDRDKSLNCVAGLTVEGNIQSPSRNDFYLLSHAGILGSEYIPIRASRISICACSEFTGALYRAVQRSTVGERQVRGIEHDHNHL